MKKSIELIRKLNCNRENVYTLCHDILDIFKTREDAKNFYTECYFMSEGAERERYASILANLNFSNVAGDNISHECKIISVQVEKSISKFLNVELENYLSIYDAIEYYDEKIQPILDVSDDYMVDFNRNIPFEKFGSDEDRDYMCTFTEYYNDIFTKFNINFDNMFTKEVSDGKYVLVLDNNIIDIRAWDSLNNVLDNVDSAIEFYKNKDKEIEQQ